MIHPTAVISPGAQIASDVEIGPYCVIGPNVKIGAGSKLMSHVVIDGLTTIGERNTFFPMAAIGHKTQDLKYKEGNKCYLEIGNDNVVREFATIHCATLDGSKTIVGNNNLIMAYCHIAHECILGNNIIMSNAATLAGHVQVGDYAVLSGMAGVHQFCRIGKMAMIGGCTKVTMDVAPFTLVDGVPPRCATINRVRMSRLGITQETINKMNQAYKIVFRQEMKLKDAVEKLKEEFADVPEIMELADFLTKCERGLTR